MAIHGSNTVEINAPIDEVYRVAADPSGAPEWQPEFKSTEVLEKDAAGNQTLMLMKVDVKVRTIDTKVRFSYDEPNGLTWKQESKRPTDPRPAPRVSARTPGRHVEPHVAEHERLSRALEHPVDERLAQLFRQRVEVPHEAHRLGERPWL